MASGLPWLNEDANQTPVPSATLTWAEEEAVESDSKRSESGCGSDLNKLRGLWDIVMAPEIPDRFGRCSRWLNWAWMEGGFGGRIRRNEGRAATAAPAVAVAAAAAAEGGGMSK